MKLMIRLLINTLAIFTAAYILKGVHIDTLRTGLVVALVLGIINAFVKPILVFLTFPITVLTLGLFIFVMNAGIILLVSHFVTGFTVDHFWWALLYGFILSVINSFLKTFI